MILTKLDPILQITIVDKKQVRVKTNSFVSVTAKILEKQYWDLLLLLKKG